ncbi:rna polymerase ii-associated protein 3 [Moniliophthora roreri]|nr:rna polymerase ii-associated protein 3 [Moniliophthora roreri]
MAPSEKAQLAKEKGNAAFKSRDYPTAIGHYSVAIIEDRNDPTFPLNRAAAYLGLDKNEDAEREIAQPPSNVKAIFRRGQARLGMGKLDEAKAGCRKTEPGNQAVEDELGKNHVLAQKNFKKASKKTARLFGSSAALDLCRRRVLIPIIEASQGASSVSQGTTTSAVQESRPAPPTPAPALSTTSTTTDSPTATVATPPKTFQDVTRAP